MGFDEVWERLPDGTMRLVSSTQSVGIPIIVNDDYLQIVIGSTDVSMLTLAQILSTYKLAPTTASDIDSITAFRIRQVISPTIQTISEDAIILQIQDQLKDLRLSAWSHEIKIQNLEFKAGVIAIAPSPADLLTAQTIASQMLTLNTTIETIRTEGTNYKTNNNLT